MASFARHRSAQLILAIILCLYIFHVGARDTLVTFDDACPTSFDTCTYIYLLCVLFRVKSDVPAVIVSKFTRAIVGALITGKQCSNVLQYYDTHMHNERSQ